LLVLAARYIQVEAQFWGLSLGLFGIKYVIFLLVSLM